MYVDRKRYLLQSLIIKTYYLFMQPLFKIKVLVHSLEGRNGECSKSTELSVIVSCCRTVVKHWRY